MTRAVDQHSASAVVTQVGVDVDTWRERPARVGVMFTIMTVRHRGRPQTAVHEGPQTT